MVTERAGATATSRRRPYPGWSIEVPDAFDEAFVREGEGYWHAWTGDRSISLTSIFLTESGRKVPAAQIAEHTRAIADPKHRPVELPPDLVGWAGTGPAEPGSIASRIVTGGLAVDGNLLIVTITSDDPVWALATWRSIRAHSRGH